MTTLSWADATLKSSTKDNKLSNFFISSPFLNAKVARARKNKCGVYKSLFTFMRT